MSRRPWISGPKELLVHAMKHIKVGEPFDYRIAMISIDNAVELTIKTYLGLPRRIRESDGPSRMELESAGSFFPSLLDLLEKYGPSGSPSIELGDIEYYHRMRNALYHDGNGITIDPEHVDGYLQTARSLFAILLDIYIDEEELHTAHSVIGNLIRKWKELEHIFMNLAATYLGEQRQHYHLFEIADVLLEKGIIDKQIYERLEHLFASRNQYVHANTPPAKELSNALILSIDSFIRSITNHVSGY